MWKDTSKMRLIGQWSDLVKYYVEHDGTVWAWHRGSGFSNCGNESDFRANFTTKYRGKLFNNEMQSCERNQDALDAIRENLLK